MKVAAHGYHAGMHLCWSGTSLFEILDPPLHQILLAFVSYSY